MLKYFILMLLLFFSCSSKKNGKIETHKFEKIDRPSITRVSIISNINRNMLMGTWAKDTAENISLVIQKDSMYYLEFPNEKYLYQIIDDTLRFLVDEEGISLKILELEKDTIVFSNDGIVELYIRRN